MKYHFILTTQQFLLEQEPLEEVLRERMSFYKKFKLPVDFWILPNPTFIVGQKNWEELKLTNKNLNSNLIIIALDKNFINWLKLRYQNVIQGEFYGPTKSIPNPLEFIL